MKNGLDKYEEVHRLIVYMLSKWIDLVLSLGEALYSYNGKINVSLLKLSEVLYQKGYIDKYVRINSIPYHKYINDIIGQVTIDDLQLCIYGSVSRQSAELRLTCTSIMTA